MFNKRKKDEKGIAGQARNDRSFHMKLCAASLKKIYPFHHFFANIK
jgi:hypothetical protein